MNKMTIQAGGVELAVRRHGQGAPLLCLHATGHGGRDFDDLSQRLESGFETIAIDWPGQGDSPADGVNASASHYSSLLDQAVEALDIREYFLLGNSIGGAAAIIHASKAPGHVKGLVLCNSAGLAPVTLLARLYCKARARRFERGANGDPRFQAWFAKYYESILPEPSARWRRDEIVADSERVAPVLAQAWRSFASKDADIRQLVPKLTMPVLYAWAKRDNALKWTWAEKAALSAPRSKVEFFEGGHSAFLEQPEAFVASFLRFSEECKVPVLAK